jgi:DNA-binding transcriptional LysR family regulator
MTPIPGRTRDLEWNDVAVILAICRAGSLGGAARRLGSTHSTVFRQLNAIEEKTGVRFFDRLRHGYVMTESGEAAKRFGERMESEMYALGREILGRDMMLQGKVRMTAPEGLATTLLPPILTAFQQEHPDVSIELIVTSLSLDLAQREADIALRVTNSPPDTSLGRKICDFGNGIYASPAYLERHKDIPLSEHSWIMSDGSAAWIISKVWRNQSRAEEQIVMSSNSITAVMGAARAGHGVATLPSFLGDSDPGLEAVRHHLPGTKLELWLLTHPDLRHTARVKALMAYLHTALRKQSGLLEGKGPSA